MIDPPAIVIQAPAFDRCRCPECKRLDAEFPGEGYQLGFWRWVPSLGPVKARGK